jgi:aminoglycoside phosphotransferase (APT) family kinase protein
MATLTISHDETKFARIAQKIDPQSKLLRAWKLEGGISAQVTALEVARPAGQTMKMVVRQHGAVDLAHNSQIAADEFRLLSLLHTAGLPVPEPYYLDQSGEIFDLPYLVLAYIEGETVPALDDVPDFIPQFTAQLASIHRVDCAHLSFLPQQEQFFARMLSERPAQLDESFNEGRIRAVLEAVWPLPRRNAPVFLHGDYWPGNVLWRDGRLVGIIDWEDAVLGDPLSDVANSRFELLWAFGHEAMQSFTHHYQAMTGIDLTHLPYWDLCSVLRRIPQISQWGQDEFTKKVRGKRPHWFIAQALEQLSTLG